MKTPTAIIHISLLIGLMVFSGCERFNKAGRGGAKGSDLSSGWTNSEDVDIDSITDETGNIISGELFHETRTPVTDVTFEPLYFAFDSFLVPPAEAFKVEAAASYLINNPSHVMVIEGHCDERGSDEYNLSLSEQRALGVKNYMVSLGIAEERLQTRPFGEEKPAVMGSGEEVWRLNRRGEFVPYK